MHLIHDPCAPAMPEIAFDDFLKVDIRVGTVLEAIPFPEARKPSYRLVIDFGTGVGIKKSAAQITENYALADLLGKRVIAVVNFPPRQIGPARSEVLILGFADTAGKIILATPERDVPDGARLA